MKDSALTAAVIVEERRANWHGREYPERITRQQARAESRREAKLEDQRIRAMLRKERRR